MRDLGAVAEFAKQVDMATEALNLHALQNNIPNTGLHPQDIAKLRKAIFQSLWNQLAVVDYLADEERDTGQLDLAEVAYSRMLQIYQGRPFHNSSQVISLLDKMASFYADLGDPIRASSCWSNITKLRDSPDQICGIAKRAWDSLADSLPQRLEIFNVLQSQITDNLPLVDIGTPFQIDEQIFNSVHNSGPTGVPFQGVPSMARTSSYSVVDSLASVANLVETVQRLPTLDLEKRDQYKRTPLFLAAFLKQEDAGHFLLRRIESCSAETSHSHLNIKDYLGQTILGAAISSGCSITFIRSLVEKGAELNPDLEARSHTPFQAACMTGNFEVASFLLDRGANINHNYPGSLHPTEFARAKGDTRILQLIHKSIKLTPQLNSPYFSQPPGQSGNDIIPTDIGNLSPSGARSSHMSMFNAQNTTSPSTSSYLAADSYFNEYLNDDGVE